MRKKRNTCGGKYYVISNPLPINENTGNFCVSEKYIMAYDKDFLFEWKNPKTNEVETKVLSRQYVVSHMKKIPKWKEDKILNERVLRGMFWIISYKDILNY